MLLADTGHGGDDADFVDYLVNDRGNVDDISTVTVTGSGGGAAGGQPGVLVEDGAGHLLCEEVLGAGRGGAEGRVAEGGGDSHQGQEPSLSHHHNGDNRVGRHSLDEIASIVTVASIVAVPSIAVVASITAVISIAVATSTALISSIALIASKGEVTHKAAVASIAVVASTAAIIYIAAVASTDVIYAIALMASIAEVAYIAAVASIAALAYIAVLASIQVDQPI